MVKTRTAKEIDEKVKNLYKVPRKAWGSWTLVGKHVFNKTFIHMKENPDLYIFQHELLPDQKWDVVCWNAAFQAASVCSRGERHLLKVIR